MIRVVLSEVKDRLGLSGGVTRGAATTFLIQVVGAGLLYLMQILLARWLGASQYGQYTYAIAWVNLLVIPASVGFDSAIIRFVPEYSVDQEGGLLRGVMVRGYQIALSGGTLVALIGISVVLLLWRRVQYAPVLVAAMGLTPIRVLMKLQTGIGRGLKSMVVAYAPQKLLRPLLIMGAIGFLVMTQEDVGAVAALVCTIIAGIGVVLVQGGMLKKQVPDYVLSSSPEFTTKKWIRVALPLLLISGFVMLLGRTDVIMLGLLEEARGVGIYNVASRTATLITFVLTSVNSIAGPTISSLYSEGKMEKLQKLATSVVHYIFWPSVLIAVAIVLLSGYILALFGTEFVEAKKVLAILAAGQVINAASGSVGYFMNMTGHQDESAWVFGTTAVLNVILNAVAIPAFGVVGAAVATSTSMAVWNIWLNILVFNRIGIHSSIVGILYMGESGYESS